MATLSFEDKSEIGHAENALSEPTTTKSASATMEPPDLVKAMSQEERIAFEKHLVRKIDIRLLPAVVIMYIMNYLDRNNIAAARIAGPNGKGLQDELGITNTQWQLCVSILFVGYILMQVPSNLVLNKIGMPALYLPTVMIVWGVISGATGAIHSFGALVAIRFLLGFVEAAYFPGVLFFLSSWYTRKELALRTALMYSGSLISGAFSGLITAGITKGLTNARGLRAWRWMFIIEGSITVFIAFGCFFILPNFPRTTSWLSEQERQLAVWRLQEDIGEDDWVSSADQGLWHGFKLAFSDIKTYILMILLLGVVSAASVTNFFPSVVSTLGYDNIKTLLLTVPPYALGVITAMLNAWHADKTGERYFHVTLPMYLAIVAFIIAAVTTATAPRYVAMMLMIPGIYTGYVVALAWISNSIPRPPDKRAAALAGINAVSNAAQIYASFMYYDAPRYITPMIVNCVTMALSIVMATLLRFILVRLNRKLDRGEYVEGAVNAGSAIPEEAASKGFRFLV
ncbi:uncharacterized protein PV09_04144 [Verruconis gallopava]|uniref:Major facilitator superfamily (MFS) profile domain-containing protein n=1 Tax=Verruconis gallopava TaxID=253628 RepID=A0A0D1YWE1_9PEZI|nr:uncharacterized protein PV09_04144 [Verruconis gallopava]KIW04982.1 hypothetical protein PV09_04144 [Verruconis gallopava]